MTESGEKKRPNSNYKLSRENPNPIEEEQLNFYYNRKHRLDKAPETVKKLYEEPLHKFNILKPLITGKARSATFFTIIILIIMIFLLSFLGFMDKSYLLDGNRLEIKATAIDDVTLLVLIKKTDSKDPYTGKVDILVYPVKQDEEIPFYTHRIDFSLREEERYSFTVPFSSNALGVELETEKTLLKILIRPE